MKKIISSIFILGFFIFWFSVFATNTQKTLLETLSEEKIKIESMFDTSYSTVYALFSSSVWWFLTSLDYKWLVCLWVIDDALLLQQMQNDSKNLKIWFLNAYANLYADAFDIEQKKRILQDTNVSLFTSWATYESEKQRIITSFSQLTTGQNNLWKQFVSSYKNKINKFVSDYADYSQKNKNLLETISPKIQSILLIENNYKKLTSDLLQYQIQLAWSWAKFFSRLQLLKQASLSGLHLSFQNSIDKEVKRNKILPTLSDELLQQKNYALWLYEMQFDEKINMLLDKRYDNKEFSQITKEVQQFLSTYMSAWKMQCSSFVSSSGFVSEAARLLTKINSFSTSFWSTLSWSVHSSEFQDAVTKWIPVIIQLQKDISKTFTNAIVQKKQILLNEYKKQSNGSGSSTIQLPQIITPQRSNSFQFTQAFKKGQFHEDIKILQQLLAHLWYYNWSIDGVYSASTLESVYQYQLAKWLLQGYEKRPATWWWMWPATRAQLNKDLIK